MPSAEVSEQGYKIRAFYGFSVKISNTASKTPIYLDFFSEKRTYEEYI